MKTALIIATALGLYAQSAPPARLEPPVPTGPPTNSAPNPYRTMTGWLQLPAGRVLGSAGVANPVTVPRPAAAQRRRGSARRAAAAEPECHAHRLGWA